MSQTIMRKRKMSEEEVEERVLEREGFVNKIIVKGITTSMFLKEDPSVSQLKDTNIKNTNRQPSLNIHTSNSVKEINEEMRKIEQQFNLIGQRSTIFTYEDEMATKIQRAWRRYKTKKLLKNIALSHINDNVFVIEDQFTDEEYEHVNSPQESPKSREK